MIVAEFLFSLRVDINDTLKTQYSDFDLMNSLNSVLKIVNNTLVKRKSDLIAKSATIPMISGIGDLPNDFIAVITVKTSGNQELYPHKSIGEGGYKITAYNIYASGDSIGITYRYAFPKLIISDEIPLPDWFSELLKKYIMMLVSNQVNKFDVSFSQMIESDVASIVSGREYTLIERDMPFTL